MTATPPASAPRARTGRARRGDGEQLRDEILDAAERLLIERGSVGAVPIRAVAGAVGVTPPSIYLHFATKDELFFAVCSRRFDEFGTTLLGAVERAQGTVDQLRAMGRAYIEYGMTHPEHYRVLFGGHVDAARHVDDVVTLPAYRSLQLLIDVCARGIAEGVLRPGDPQHTAIGLWSVTHGYVSLVITHEHDHLPGIDLADAVDSVLEQALRGIIAGTQPGAAAG